MLTTILTFVILLSVLVLVHELGHFLAAKLAGIRVEEFGMGLPPKVWGKKIGETIYSINLLPIGGFVRLTGEEGEEAASNDPKSFASQNNWVKSIVIVAGVIMNFLLGVLLIGIVVGSLGVPEIHESLQIKSVVQNSPAQSAGITQGDTIVGFGSKGKCLIKDKVVKSGCQMVESIQPDKFIEFVKQHAGSEIVLLVFEKKEKANQAAVEVDSEPWSKVISLVPRRNPPKNEGALGVIFVAVPRIVYQQVGWRQVPITAFKESYKLAVLVFVGVKDTLVELLTKGVVPKDVAGPVGIAKITGDVARQGVFPTLQFAALLSINLGIINILPFPALDGGRLFFIVVEGLTGRKIHANFQRWVHTIGIVILLTLMLIITFFDIARFL